MKTHWSWLVLVAGLAACSDKPEKVWIVVDLIDPAGKPAQMAFDNPRMPDMTMQDCEDALASAVPTLMEGISSRPESRGSRYVSARCVPSATDPIKPEA